MIDFIARANRYADAVLSGRILACKWVKAACRRYLDDLERQETDWPYRLDPDAGTRICEFLQLLPHVEGEWARPIWVDGFQQYRKLDLEDWQVFGLVNIFGWLHKESGLRRFRRAYEEVARKNAKSTKAAGVALYMLGADGEPGAQVYTFATKKEQAKIVWATAKAMVEREPGFGELGVETNTGSIYCSDTNSKFLPLARDHGSLDGLNTHAFVADELHAQRERGLYDVLDSSTGARSQPLGYAITTAGFDRTGICYEQRTYACKILNATLLKHGGMGYKVEGDSVEDDTFFAIIYTLDAGDDWQDESVWIKSNPNLGVSVKLDDMRAACRKATSMLSARNEFLTKRLNVWVNAATAWMNMLQWDACSDPSLRLEQFRGEQCWIGMDLAEKNDYAALVLVFRRAEDYYVFPRFYLNRFAAEESGNAQLSGWEAEGWVRINEGNVTDFEQIRADLRDFQRMFDLLEVDFDPAKAMYFATTLLDEGLPMTEIRQNGAFFTQPVIHTENLVLEGKLHFDGNPALTWMVSNVVIQTSSYTGLKHPTKETEANKIDGPVAMFMGLGRAMVADTSHTQLFVNLNEMA